MNDVFVLSSTKKPLMPCHPAKARELLATGQAAVYSKAPFTIILLDFKPKRKHFRPAGSSSILGIVLVLLLAAPLALASDEDDACGAILCLAGEMTGTGGGRACQNYISQYFSIVEKHHGDFSPSRTARKRMEFLDQCQSGESDTKEQVNGRYGMQRRL